MGAPAEQHYIPHLALARGALRRVRPGLGGRILVHACNRRCMIVRVVVVIAGRRHIVSMRTEAASAP